MATAIPRIPRDKLDPDFVPAWDMLDRLTGEPAFVETFANAPAVLRFVMHDFYERQFFGGTLDNRYKQLARLRLSILHGCRTCNRQNTVGLADAGYSDGQVDSVADFENGEFNDAEKAVMRFADQVALTNPGGHLSDTLRTELRAHFTDEQICELGAVMAVISGFAKLSFVMDVVEREPYCPFVADD